MYSTYYGSRQDGYGYNADMLREGFDLLEARADCLGWWSVARRVLRSYGHQPIIRLRRSSDSAERDFYGIGPQGEVSTAAVRAFNGWNLVPNSGDLSTGWAGTNGGTIISAISFSTNNTTSRVQQAPATMPAGTYTITAKFGVADVGKSIRLAFFAGSWDTGVNITIDANGFASRTFTAGASVTNIAMAGLSTITTVTYTAFEFIQIERASSFSTYEPRGSTGAGDSFLVTLYDQSGLARHFTQSTTTLQPIICEQGVPVTENGRLAAKFVAADGRRMSIASSTAMFNALHTTGGSVLAVSRANDTAASKALFRNNASGTSAGFLVQRLSNEALSVFAARIDVAGTPTNGTSVVASSSDTISIANAINAITIDPDNATASLRCDIWQNGTKSAAVNAETGTPAIENAAGDMTLGASSAGATPWDGTISEVAAFSSLISTADRTAWQSRSGVFYTVTIS